MPTKYLSNEWAEMLDEALNADEGFRKETAKRRSLIQWSISDAPDGDVDYHIDIDHGKACVGLGTPSSPPDLTMSCSYGTMVGIINGQIAAREAFQTRRLRADARLITVLRYLGVFHELGRVMETLDIDY